MEQLANVTTANNTKVRKQSLSDLMRIQDFLFLCLGHWWWFVISLGITLGYATYYLKKTTPVYVRSASILLQSDDIKNNTGNALRKLGITRDYDYNINNEIMSMTTIPVATEVVKRLNLDVNYMRDGMFRKEIVYGLNLPVDVRFEDLNDNDNVSMNLVLKSDGTIIISNMIRNGVSVGTPLKFSLDKTVKSPFGKIIVKASPYYKKGMSDKLEITRSNIHAVAASLLGRISVRLRDRNSTVLDVVCSDESTARAEDILNTLLAVYNENWIRNRNQVTISTNDFIKERLAVIEQELGGVDQEISDYKSSNLMLDVNQVGAKALSEVDETETRTYDIDNQLYILRFVRNYLTDGFHDNQLLPNSAGMGNGNIEGQISQYNNILLQRNNHLANSSTQNPVVMELDEHLASLRVIIIQSIDNAVALLQAQKNKIRNKHDKAVSVLASNPGQQKYMLSIERQQKVKESLYLFLLQRREENELSQAFTAYNTQVIEVPHGSMAPVSPDKNNVWLWAWGLGLAIPIGILIIMESMNTVVRGRKDLGQMLVPFVGEIPLAVSQKKGLFKSKEDKADVPEMVVVEKSRNVMNEAFRVVRTNLEFMLGFDNNHQVIMITSMNPGSGKTFITANLSTALAIKDKKVLAIDLDLRRASLSKYVDKPHKGVSNYLSGQEHDYHSLIKQMGKVDVLPCGKIPPNPTELLFSPKFQQLIEEVREEYDFVFIDCPPVEIVADATIINRFANLTLFIIRAQLMDRSLLPDIEQWYDEKRFKNLSILLNGTTDAFSLYGYHRYGYRYGYHYGYYGYGYGEKDKRKQK